MRVIIKKNYDEMSDWVSLYIKNRIQQTLKDTSQKDQFVLGLPTGSTPLGVYQKFIEYYQTKTLDFSRVATFNMDEYVNLPQDHDQSYHYFMHHHLFNHINIDKKNINMLDGNAIDLPKECLDYENKIIKAGGIDLFLGGIGADGHIAFNEPGSSLTSRTRIKTLCDQTIKDNSRFFQDINQVPRTALTVGVGTVLDAREIVIMISGEKKATALYKCIEEGVNHMWTVSALQQHPKVTIVCDEAATSELKVKTVNYFKDLQITTDMMGHPIYDQIATAISDKDKVIIFSPHPDDDVIGIGGTMQLIKNKHNVTVVYMTSGAGGLPLHLPKDTREKEAKFALKILGYHENQIKFLNLPFYNDKKPVSEQDYRVIADLYQEIQPTHIFVCGDDDPNGTHKKCYQVLFDTEKYLEHHSCIKNYWIYKGAWGTWDQNLEYKPNCYVHLPKDVFKLKELAVLAHQSQDPPVVTNSDTRTFVQRVIEHNTSDRLPGEYAEKLLRINQEQFVSRMYI